MSHHHSPSTALTLIVRSYALIALSMLVASAQAAPTDDGFVPLFNGVDLNGWAGDPRLWSVEDGAITGRTTPETPATSNTFLIWKGGEPRDFELRLKFRLPDDEANRGANSGIQYRSRVIDAASWRVAGYQADFDAARAYTGMLYEEGGRGILAKPGEQVRLSKDKETYRHDITGTTATASEIRARVRLGEWNDYVIIAERNHLRHYVNGSLTAEVHDDTPQAASAGVLALQLHAGAPMTVQFKDIRLKVRAAAREPRQSSAPRALSGFKVDLIYTVPGALQGSWVSLAVDAKGRLIAADGLGALYRIVLPAREGAPTQVELLPTPVGGAQGLLYAFDALYVMVNTKRDVAPGLWRLRDTDGDEAFDEAKLLREMDGRGEHGPHAIVLGPDKKSIYVANGNHTALPAPLERSRAVAWSEDHLLPRLWDPNGHAVDVFAPGGYVARTDPDGMSFELYGLGFRNQYDIAFDANGDLFTYDSDMEWDQGTPWYVPTRINHVVDGGDYGWRSGSARWPAYYADSLPAVLDVGPGSPTGLVFGTGAKFPAAYQRAFFACDWTYGTLYAVHLTPHGATFRAQKEEFVTGKPLPLTDVVIRPQDGAMYFIVGGRGTQSALYRVRYVGSESTAPVAALPPTPEARLRRSLEALHAEDTGPQAIDVAWPQLSNPDRFVRYAARVAIERQPVDRWAQRALDEKNPQAAIEALTALARMGDKHLQPRILEALGRLDLARLPREQQLALLRAWQLTFTRMGRPQARLAERLAVKFEPLFPHADGAVNRELVALLVYLDSRAVVAKTLPLLSVTETEQEDLGSAALLSRNEGYGRAVQKAIESRPDRQQIAYAYALRNARVGWTPQRRLEFFSWFARTHAWKGGNSFAKFLEAIRSYALATIVSDPNERAALAKLSARPDPTLLSQAATPKGPGRAYTVEEAVAVTAGRLTARSFEQGRAMFAAGACIACHRFQGEGGNVGPDLSGAGNRYTVRDLIESIVEPSKVISDQYGSAPSAMPAGLINAMNADELADLLAYVLSGGNPNDPRFRKIP